MSTTCSSSCQQHLVQNHASSLFDEQLYYTNNSEESLSYLQHHLETLNDSSTTLTASSSKASSFASPDQYFTLQSRSRPTHKCRCSCTKLAEGTRSCYWDKPSRPFDLLSTIAYYQQETHTILDQLTFLQHAYPEHVQDEIDVLAQKLRDSAIQSVHTSAKIHKYHMEHHAKTSSVNGIIDTRRTVEDCLKSHDDLLCVCKKGPHPLVFDKFYGDYGSETDVRDDASVGSASLHTDSSFASVHQRFYSKHIKHIKVAFQHASRSIMSLPSMSFKK